MVYLLDTCSIRVFSNYYPSSFPKFWELLANSVEGDQVLSVREVFRELEKQSVKPHLISWATANKRIFVHPTEAEMAFVSRLFEIEHFRQLVGEKQISKGSPVADPFLMAAAHERSACVVTEEQSKENAAKIPNVCARFDIECINVEEMMRRERWSF